MSAMTRVFSAVTTGKFYYGWVIVGIAFMCNMFSSGTGGYGLGLFMKPMNAELGWSNTQIIFGQTVKSWVNSFSAPVLGQLVDRLGPRNVMMFGGLLGGGSLVALSFVQET